MTIQNLTDSEKVLLSSVGISSLLLFMSVMICIVKKGCWLHKCIWKQDKKKNPDDIICIRYPPDMYPASVGIYRENILRSPEDELARLFSSPVKRDSTYSSMSETSSAYELTSSSSPHIMTSSSSALTITSPVTGTAVSTPESPDSASHLIASTASPGPISASPSNDEEHLAAAEAAAVAQRQLAHQHHNLLLMNNNHNRQPFFTFALKYEEGNGLVHIEFIEARNLPFREYLNQPSDAFFTVEIQPKKANGPKREMMRYRFVTKTIRKAVEACDFSEKFLAQLSKANLKDYIIRFTAFDQDRHGNPTELGSTTLTFDDFRDFTLHRLILSCSLKEPILKRGELLIGLCYLPTAERMSVTIVKVTNLNPYFSHGTITKQSICYVRVLLMRADTGRVLKRKKTTFQRVFGSTNADQPLFNETLVFDMPPGELIQTVLLVLVCFTDKPPVGNKLQRDDCPSAASPNNNPLHLPPTGCKGVADEGLFHYSDDLNVNRSSETRSTSSSSNSTAITTSTTNTQNNSSSESSNPGKNPSSADDAEENPQQSQTENSEKYRPSKPSKVKDNVVGKVAFGYSIKNPIGKYHWEKMIRSPRNVSTEWHSLK